MRLVKLIAGILLGGIALLGSLYFRHYRGELIAHPGLWQLLFIAVGVVAFLLLVSSFRSTKKEIVDEMNDARIRFLRNAEKTDINFDDCVFNNGFYTHDTADENVSTLNWISPAPTYFHTPEKLERVLQSYLVYTDPSLKQRFISHTFDVDADTLRYYVLTNRITLYVSRHNPREYLFDLT